MSKAIEVSLGSIAGTLFHIYNRKSILPMWVRVRFFRSACWFLERKFALREFVRLQRFYAEEKRMEGDRSNWWGDW